MPSPLISAVLLHLLHFYTFTPLLYTYPTFTRFPPLVQAASFRTTAITQVAGKLLLICFNRQHRILRFSKMTAARSNYVSPHTANAFRPQRGRT